jgi:hypothetical protein
MEKYGIKILYAGHYFGNNVETKQRIDDEAAIGRDVLAGKLMGEENSNGMAGLNRIITAHGVRIDYSDAMKKIPSTGNVRRPITIRTTEDYSLIKFTVRGLR